MKSLLLIAGVVLLAAGLFFAGQGSGFIPWPATSLMVSNFRWVYYGGFIAVGGLFLILYARRR